MDHPKDVASYPGGLLETPVTPEPSGRRGSTQSGIRAYNERLVLSLVRHHRALTKAAMAKMTGLTLQTISIITNQLTDDGLLLRGMPQRGRVGQPSVPYSL